MPFDCDPEEALLVRYRWVVRRAIAVIQVLFLMYVVVEAVAILR